MAIGETGTFRDYSHKDWMNHGNVADNTIPSKHDPICVLSILPRDLEGQMLIPPKWSGRRNSLHLSLIPGLTEPPSDHLEP